MNKQLLAVSPPILYLQRPVAPFEQSKNMLSFGNWSWESSKRERFQENHEDKSQLFSFENFLRYKQADSEPLQENSSHKLFPHKFFMSKDICSQDISDFFVDH